MSELSRTCLFTSHTLEDHAQSIAYYLPDGQLWAAKNREGTVMRNLLLGLAHEFKRAETVLIFNSCEYDINTTTQFLTEWERAVGIPDECFPGSGSVEERRSHILAKLAAINATTKEDLIHIANLLGFSINITTPQPSGEGFPLTFPYTFGKNLKESKFTIIVEFLDIIDYSVFPYTFPLTFADGQQIENFVTCFFRKIIPANVALEFVFQLPPSQFDYFIYDNGDSMITDSGDRFRLD